MAEEMTIDGPRSGLGTNGAADVGWCTTITAGKVPDRSQVLRGIQVPKTGGTQMTLLLEREPEPESP